MEVHESIEELMPVVMESHPHVFKLFEQSAT